MIFKTWQAAVNYYRAEGFELSECSCRMCGHKTCCFHFPVDTPAYINVACSNCGAQLLDITNRIIQQPKATQD